MTPTEYYPLFHPEYDDEGKIRRKDYVFCYSLLLHFCFVERPDKKSIQNCLKMREAIQTKIKDFMVNIKTNNFLNRDVIKAVIDNLGIKLYRCALLKLYCNFVSLHTKQKQHENLQKLHKSCF